MWGIEFSGSQRFIIIGCLLGITTFLINLKFVTLFPCICGFYWNLCMWEALVKPSDHTFCLFIWYMYIFWNVNTVDLVIIITSCGYIFILCDLFCKISLSNTSHRIVSYSHCVVYITSQEHAYLFNGSLYLWPPSPSSPSPVSVWHQSNWFCSSEFGFSIPYVRPHCICLALSDVFHVHNALKVPHVTESKIFSSVVAE